MARQVSIVVVYPADADFESLLGAPEREFLTRLASSGHRRVGSAKACIIDVLVPNDFALHATQRRLEALPAAGISIMERFRESWWRRHRWPIAIGIIAGLAVTPATELLRPLVARMREALG